MLVEVRCFNGQSTERPSKNSSNMNTFQPCNQGITDTETGELVAFSVNTGAYCPDGPNKVGTCEKREIIVKYAGDYSNVTAQPLNWQEVTPAEALKLCPPVVPPALQPGRNGQPQTNK